MSANPAAYIPHTATEDERRWRDNTARLLAYNRALGHWRYYGLDATAMPERPLLAGADQTETRYETPLWRGEGEDGEQHPFPIGGGPDRFGYFEVIAPDNHPVGGLFNAPDGGIYLRCETPAREGGFLRRWLRVI